MGTEQNTGAPAPLVQAFEAMLRQQATEADCQLCLSQLHDYVVAQQSGEDYREQFGWAARHLDSCVACAEAYGLLYEIMLAETTNRLSQPDKIPAPDLSFLTAVPPLPTLLQQAIRQTRQRITIQLNKALTALLVPLPQTALTRSAGNERYSRKLLELTPAQVPEVSLPLTLAAYADAQRPGFCLVEVALEPPGVSWPDLGGWAITLAAGEKSWHAQTDEWGTAVFPDVRMIDLDTLLVNVAIDSRRLP